MSRHEKTPRVHTTARTCINTRKSNSRLTFGTAYRDAPGRTRETVAFRNFYYYYYHRPPCDPTPTRPFPYHASVRSNFPAKPPIRLRFRPSRLLYVFLFFFFLVCFVFPRRYARNDVIGVELSNDEKKKAKTDRHAYSESLRMPSTKNRAAARPARKKSLTTAKTSAGGRDDLTATEPAARRVSSAAGTNAHHPVRRRTAVDETATVRVRSRGQHDNGGRPVREPPSAGYQNHYRGHRNHHHLHMWTSSCCWWLLILYAAVVVVASFARAAHSAKDGKLIIIIIIVQCKYYCVRLPVPSCSRCRFPLTYRL